MMRTRIAPLIRAIFIITALVLGQIQVVVAADTVSVSAPDVSGEISASTAPGGPSADVLRQGELYECKVYVNTFYLDTPYDGPGVGDDLSNSYGASVVANTWDSDPSTTNSSPPATTDTGATTIWLVAIQNASGNTGCGNSGSEELFDIYLSVAFSGTNGGALDTLVGTDTSVNWPDPDRPGVLPEHGDVAWWTFEWVVPANVNGNLQITTTFESEAEYQTIVNDPDVVDGDLDEIGVSGPGIELSSFLASDPDTGSLVTEAEVGALLDYTLIIENTRPNSIIRWLDITSSEITSISSRITASCGDLSQWTMSDGASGILNPGVTATCVIGDVPVEGDPLPSTFVITATIEVSEDASGADTDNYTLAVKSTGVTVLLPEVSVSKSVYRVQRSGTTIYSGSGTLDPVLPGDVITYEIIVTNSGEVELRNLFIVDTLTGPVYVPTASKTLAPGDNYTTTTTHTVQSDGQDPLQNTVSVTATASVSGTPVEDEAVVSVDVADSELEIVLTVLDPTTGTAWTGGVVVGDTVMYQLTVYNLGSVVIENLQYISVVSPLVTLGTPTDFTPDYIAANSSQAVTWLYTVPDDASDPLVNTVRVRGQTADEGTLLYAQDSATLDVTNPDIGISVDVIDPAGVDTILRGQTIQYQVTVENKNSEAICSVSVDQIRRNQTTGTEYTILAGIPFTWTGTAGEIEGNGSITTVVSYLVTGEDLDPLAMIFEVTAVDCSTSEALTDRATRILDISDVQLNTQLTPSLEPAPLGTEIEFTYQAINISSMELEEITATWCLYRDGVAVSGYCNVLFDDSVLPNLPTTLGAFEDVSDVFSYTITSADAEANPFLAEVTLKGRDNKGNWVQIRTARTLAIATPDLTLTLTGPSQAVFGDTITFDYNIVNETGGILSDVSVYNLLVEDSSNAYGYENVGDFSSILGSSGQNTAGSSFDYTIDSLDVIEDDVLTMLIRLVGESDAGSVIATATYEVEIIPMIEVVKSGDTSSVAGTSVHYYVTITNNSSSQTLTITDYEDDVLADYGVSVGEADFSGWDTVGELAPGASVTASFMIPGPPEDTSADGVSESPSPLVNTFIVDGTRPDGSPVSGLGSHSVSIACPIDFYIHAYSTDDDPDYVLGETLRWSVGFTNISETTLDSITIFEALDWDGAVTSDKIQWPGTAGVLEPGETAWVEGKSIDEAYFEILITSDYILNSSTSMITDVVSASFSDGTESSSCSESLSVPIYSPVQIAKYPSTTLAYTGEVVTYTFVMTNVTESDDAPYDEYYVTVTDSLVQADPIAFQYDGTDASDPWLTSGYLGPGETVTAQVDREVLASDPDTLTNVVTAEFPDPTNSDVTLYTTASAEVYTGSVLRLTKTPSTDSAAPGAWITYDYSVTNISEYPVTINSLIDDMAEIGNIIPNQSGGTITLDPDTGVTTYTWLDQAYQIPYDAVGSVQNTVTVDATVELPTGDRDITTSVSAVVSLTASELSVSKTIYSDNGGVAGDELEDTIGVADGVPDVVSGTPVHYCFVVTNRNSVVDNYIYDIVIQDAMFPNLQDSFTGAVSTLHGGTEPQLLYGGESVEFCEGPITLTAALGDPLTNSVTITGTTLAAVPVYSEDSVTVDIRGADLLVTKLPSQTVAFVGDEVQYTITLYNNNASVDVEVGEVIDEFISGAPTSIPLDWFDWSASKVDGSPVGMLGANGGMATFTYPYEIEADDPDPLENTVTATGWLNDAVDPDDRTVVSDSTRAILAVPESQLYVTKTVSPSSSNASANTCVDTSSSGCKTVRYTISVTNLGSSKIYNLMLVDEHFDVYAGDTVYQVFEGDDLEDTELGPYESTFIYYDLPMPTSAQIAANADLDPFLNKVTAYGVLLDGDGKLIPMSEQLYDTEEPYVTYDQAYSLKGTATAAVDIVQPNIRVRKTPETLASTAGGNATYTITITNIGDTNLQGLTFEDLVGDDGVINLDTLCMTGSTGVCDWFYGNLPYKDYDTDGISEYNPMAGLPYDPDTHGLQPQEQLIGTVEVIVPDDWDEVEFTNVVEVTGITEDFEDVLDRSSATIDIRDDGILVEKFVGATQVPLGSAVQYTVRVTNVGSSSLEQLLISDAGMDDPASGSITVVDGFPDDPDIDGDDTGQLDPGEEYELTYTHTMMPEDGDLYVNRVTVIATTVDGTPVMNSSQAAVDVETALVDIEKYVCLGEDTDTVMPDDCETIVNIGDTTTPDTVTYYIYVSNPGALPLTNVEVTDSYAGEDSCDLTLIGDGLLDFPSTLDANDSVPNGGTDEAVLMYHCDVVPGDPDPLTNLVMIRADTETGVSVQATASAELSLVTSDLVLSKDGPTEATIGQVVTYTVTVTHAGDSSSLDIDNIQVIDPLSDTYGTAPITECAMTSLSGGDSYSCSFTHTVTQADVSPLVNTATATGTQGSTLVSDAATHTLEIVTAGLSVSKFADKQYASIGDEVTYTYRVENTGSSVINSLVVTESDPDAVFSSAWPTFMIPGQELIRTWTRTMTALDADPYTNTLTVTGVVSGSAISADATESVYLSNGSLIVSNVPSVTYATAGQIVNFSYTVTNLGPDPLQDLVLTNNLCDDTTLNTALPDTLAAGVSATVYCSAVASLPGPLVSSVYVSGNETPDGGVTLIPVSDTANAEVAVTDGGLLVTKTADSTTAAPGDVVTYTIRVENVSGEQIGGFVVDDLLVVGLAPSPPVRLNAGQNFTMTGTYTIPDPAPSSVVNTATVTATGISTGAEYSDSDSASVAVIEPGSTGELILTKRASILSGRPGDMVTYTFTIQNITSDVTVTDGQLIDSMLVYAVPSIASGTIDLPTLGPGNAWTRSYTVQIPSDWVTPTFVNTAEVRSDSGAILHDTASVTVDVEVLALTKSAYSPVLLGDTIVYTFDVTNYSAAPVPLVTLDDPLIETWTATLPDPIPVSDPVGTVAATATGEFVVPDTYTASTVDNTATLNIDDVEVATSDVSVNVLQAGLLMEIVSIEQVNGSVALTIPQTGEPVTVNVRLTNFGTVDIDDPGYTVTFDIAGAVCTPTETLPAVFVAGDVIETSCRYTPPRGAADYFVDPYLVRTVTAVATGVVESETVESMPAETTVQLVDPWLVVELSLDPESALPGEDVDVTLTVRNAGASSIGCPVTVAATEPCHLSFTDDSDDDILTDLFEDLFDLYDFENIVLSPAGAADGSDEVSFTETYSIGSSDETMTLSAVVDGGYFSASLLAQNLLAYYTVYDDDEVELVVERSEIEVTLTVVPNPPVYGSTVNYYITVTNTGPVTVSNLVAMYRLSPYAAAVPDTDGIMLVSSDSSPVTQTVDGWIVLSTTELDPDETASGVLSKVEDQDSVYNFLVTVYGTGIVDDEIIDNASDSTYLDLYPDTSILATTTPTVDPATLDANAVDPQVTKTASSTSAQPGDTLTWTVTVRNGWTSTMSGVTLQDNVPTSLTIAGGTVDRGSISVDGQYVTVTIGTMSPGEIATLTLNTVVGTAVASPSIITNTACAQHTSSAQACGSASVPVGPDVTGLPSTGIISTPEQGAGTPLAGFLSVALIAGLILMGLNIANRRTQIAVLVVGLVVVIIAVVVVIAVTGGDEKPSDVAQSDTSEGGGGADVAPTDTEGGTADDGTTTMTFPPEPTPYIVPTPAGMRALIIPKLSEQFSVPVQIVDLPLSGRQWDVSGLGYYIGWLEGTTWMDTDWGNTVLAAHVQLGFENPGPFWGLTELVPGDEIIVVEGEIERRFQVQSITKVDPSDWTVTAPTTSPTLTLITCTEWDNNYGVFSQRLVVRAVPLVEVPQG